MMYCMTGCYTAHMQIPPMTSQVFCKMTEICSACTLKFNAEVDSTVTLSTQTVHAIRYHHYRVGPSEHGPCALLDVHIKAYA